MTSKLTREQLHERARENVKALKMASRQTAFESAREEILADLQLAELALAAMDSEPVAWREPFTGRCVSSIFYQDGSSPLDHGYEPLYSAPQEPVVPEEMTAEQAYEIGDYHGDPVDVLVRGANWMRQHIIDSTLAAAPQSPGSEPATVPGKWIPVSERMPEDRTQVILWDAEIGEVTSGHYSHKTQTFYHCGDAIENEITHWMPPPCAPQEVKGE